MHRFRRGLVVGKFAPLHRGHELVIRRALAECSEVVLISYANPEPPGCGAERRAAWLAELFPQTRRLVVTSEWRAIPPDSADDETHRRFTGRLCLDVLGLTVDAVFTSEDYGDGFAATLTALFREDDPAAPAVMHVLVDRARKEVPISASLIRADIHAHRSWLPPVVYASFVRRMALLGGESSGKSTLAEQLARALATVHVDEFGRELWERCDGKLVEEDLLEIAHRQIAREDAALRSATRWLICDTTPLTTLFYAGEMFGRADPELEKLAARPYDATALCAPDFPFVQDGTRRDAAFREKQHAWYLAELSRRRIPHVAATGSPEERVAQLVTHISRAPDSACAWRSSLPSGSKIWRE